MAVCISNQLVWNQQSHTKDSATTVFAPTDERAANIRLRYGVNLSRYSVEFKNPLRGDLARAESLYEETLGRFPVGDVSRLSVLVDLAGVKLALGKRGEAETLFDQATGSGRKNWGADDPGLERLLTRIREVRAAAKRHSIRN